MRRVQTLVIELGRRTTRPTRIRFALAALIAASAVVCAAQVVRADTIRPEHATSLPGVSPGHAALGGVITRAEPQQLRLLRRWGAAATLLVAAALAACRFRARPQIAVLTTRRWRGNVNRRGPPLFAILI